MLRWKNERRQMCVESGRQPVAHIWTGPLTRDALSWRFRHERLMNVADPDEAGLMHFEEEQRNGQGCNHHSDQSSFL